MLIARLATVPVLLLGACDSGQVGYAQSALGGDIGFAAGSTTADSGQDVTTAVGFGDDQGTPGDRLSSDVRVPTFTESGFVFEEEGTGTHTSNFGGNPLLGAGANDNPDFEPSNAEASLVFDVSSGAVTVSRGLAADYFDLSLELTQVNGLASDLVELEAPLPIGVLRAAGGMEGIFNVEADVGEVEAEFVDIDVMLTVRATDVLDLLVGYRYLALDGDGLIDNDAFLTDIAFDGLVLGGGVRF